MKKIFRNSRGRLRAIWRMALYLLISVITLVPVMAIFKLLVTIFPFESKETGVTSTINLLFVLALNIGFLVGAWITLKRVDRRPAALLGLNFWWVSLKEFLIGFAVGLANFGAVLIILVLAGYVSLEPAGISVSEVGLILRSIAVIFVFAAFEELINRGYLFQAFCEGAGVWIAAVTVSVIFSLVHIVNPAFSLIGAIFLFVHGLLYAFAYLKTRSLWTPIGLHMAWNLAQGQFAGMNVSGSDVGASLFNSTVSGPTSLTGGEFGIEGSLITVIISAVILVAVIKASWLKPSPRFQSIERKWAENTRLPANSQY
ncbi:MAG: CPBP family intramembrane metalloprotease [Candidatus Zixiibacteriota bacterium]|nr:MAG: CPBP family intramembrane metalloprotease [candidate division Zixibacteria bacterium]